jgi:hypothetical protein
VEDAAPTRIDTLHIEGMSEPVMLHRHESPRGFPLPFATYVPEGMTVDTLGADALRFSLNEAGLLFRVFPAGQGAGEARRQIGAMRGLTETSDAERPQWAEGFWYLNDGVSGGWVALGSEGGHSWLFESRYPYEYADGFGPRTEVILANWWWLGTGEKLRAD